MADMYLVVNVLLDHKYLYLIKKIIDQVARAHCTAVSSDLVHFVEKLSSKKRVPRTFFSAADAARILMK